jgi:hypothetical protein
MNNLAEEMEQHSTVKMNRVQKRVYENSIKRFKEAASSLN